MHDNDNTQPRARRRMALGVLLALVLVALLIGLPTIVIIESTMDLVEAQWP